MKRSIVRFKVCVVVVLVVALGSNVSADIYTGLGPDNEFSTAANWDTNNAPSSGVSSEIEGPFIVERSVDSENDRTIVNGGGVLNITGGVHNDSSPDAGISTQVGRGGTGTVNHSAGTWNIGHGLRIGTSRTNSNGTYNLTGGTLNVSRTSNARIDPAPPGGRPSIQVGGLDAGSAGLFGISGGTLTTRGSVHVLDTGTFSIVGSGATIGIGSTADFDGSWIQRAGGTLRARIDEGGVTPIFVDDVDLGNPDQIFAIFENESLLDLGFDGIDPIAGTWELLIAENTAITNLGLTLTAETAANPGWSFAVDNSGVNGLLTATFTPSAIPEPSATILFGLGGVLLAGRRRK